MGHVQRDNNHDSSLGLSVYVHSVSTELVIMHGAETHKAV